MSAKPQNFSNHARFVPLYHYVVFGVLVLMLIGAVVNLFQGENCGQLFPWLYLITVLNLVLIALFARSFALKAQDRAIRAEESLRYFILTGKRVSTEMRMGQFIALRFASDEEFVALADRAVKEKMSPSDIKKAIQNWRPDYNRA